LAVSKHIKNQIEFMQNQKAIKLYAKGRRLQQKTELLAAVRAYRQAIKIKPDFVEALNNLGNVLVDLGSYIDAAKAYRKAVKLLPEHPMLMNNLGNVLQLQGENKKAIEWFKSAIALDLNYADAYCNLGHALKDLGDLEKASKSYQTAIQLDPANQEAYNGFGNILVKKGEPEEAVIAFQKVVSIDPNHKEAYNGLGNALLDIGEIERAIISFRRAIELNPYNKEAYRGLGNVHNGSGNLELAIDLYRQVLKVQPDDAQAYRMLSACKKFSSRDDDLHTMELLMDKSGGSDQQNMNLAYGLGKAYEDLQEYEKSMTYIIEANRLKRKSVNFDNSVVKKAFDDIKDSFSKDFFDNRDKTGSQDASPIFILGMPRSGTSLAEQILASHPHIFGAGELTLLSKLTLQISEKGSVNKYPQGIGALRSDYLQELGDEYIEKIRKHSGSAKYIIDKMPHNFLYIGFIKTILPNAKIIHCTRNPMDNCLSLFKNYFATGHLYSYEMTELGQYYGLYLDMMKHWQLSLPGFCYELRYEQLVENVEAETRNLLEYCNLPWDKACLDFHKTERLVQTASSAQVRRPIYNGSVELWTRYEKQLSPLHNAIYGMV
jgi:tetratricopeptide (TPR) repeat protein